jgi:GNAT superfamily N-acetyltransferase
MRVSALDESLLPAWQALFEVCASPCYCRYWHFQGTKNDWLDRCAHRPQENRDEQIAFIRSGVLEARGLLAMEGSTAMGWMKLAPRAGLIKLRRQGAYRGLDLGPDDGVWSIGCLLVRPDRRGQGVAQALIAASPAAVRSWSTANRPARMIESYPRGNPSGNGSARLHDEEAWIGTQGLFERCGFVRVAGEPAYPVMRLAL